MKLWNAVILAGDRAHNDPVAKIAGVSCKAEARIGSSMLLSHVTSALAKSESVDQIYCVGPDDRLLSNASSIAELFRKYNVTRLPVELGPSLSALRGVQASQRYPTLIVTCDLPLINADLVDQYCRSLNKIDADFVIGAIDSRHIVKLLPDLRKTTYQFGKHSVCFANLFSVLTESGMRAIEFWQNIEGSRKKPLEVIRQVGGMSILQYKLGKLSLEQAARRLSRKTAATIAIEEMPHPELAVDVDSVEDFQILQSKLSVD